MQRPKCNTYKRACSLSINASNRNFKEMNSFILFSIALKFKQTESRMNVNFLKFYFSGQDSIWFKDVEGKIE